MVSWPSTGSGRTELLLYSCRINSKKERVDGLRQTNFYKSMTTHTDHRIWQDVYHADLKSGLKVYIKLTLRENGIVVIQFKEK